MSIEDDLRQAVGERQGAAIKFTDIDGIGQKTEQKIKNTVIPGKGRVRGPSDVSDLTAQELAQEAGISESRAQKAIRGGGGNPSISETGRSGSVEAGNIADALENQRERQIGALDDFGMQTGKEGLRTAGRNVDRQDGFSRRRKAEQSEITEASDDDLITLGRLSQALTTASTDPIDPTKSARVDLDEETESLADRASTAARSELGGRGFDRDDITSQFQKPAQRKQFDDPFLQTAFFGPQNFGEWDTDREEFARARKINQDRSREAQRVDNRRDAPVTDEISRWRRKPGELDYPGIDTPEEDPADVNRPRDTSSEMNTGGMREPSDVLGEFVRGDR
jgi:hypothetical protein